jgi:hypothetical protein
VYFIHVEIIFPKKFSALSPEGSQLKKNGLFFRQQILALIHSIFFGNGYISNITPDFYENK